MESKKLNINRKTFEIENEGYDKLEEYLSQLRKNLKNNDDSFDIITDIEERISDQLDILKNDSSIVETDSITTILNEIGDVDQFKTKDSNTTKKIILTILAVTVILSLCGVSSIYMIGKSVETVLTAPFRIFENISDDLFGNFFDLTDEMNEEFQENSDENHQNFLDTAEENQEFFQETTEEMQNDFMERQDEIDKIFEDQSEFNTDELQELYDSNLEETQKAYQ